MDGLLQLIFILAFMKVCLSPAFLKRFRGTFIYALCAGVFAYAVYPLVIRQRADSFTAILADKGLVADFAVLVTVEAVLGIMICIYLLDNYFKPKEKRKKSVFMLKLLPGPLFFVGIFYFELMFFKEFPGVSFGTTALLYSLLIFGLITLVSLVLRYVMSGESLKLEAKILFNIAILLVGLLLNSSISAYNVAHSSDYTELAPTLTMVGGIILLSFVGYVFYVMKIKTKFKKQLKQK